MKIENVIDKLNEILYADPAAINILFKHKTVCNEALANHPTVQVQQSGVMSTVRFIGILNGFLEPMFGSRVAIKTNDKNEIVEFVKYEL